MISRRITCADIRNTYIADDDGVLVITQDLVRNLWHITGIEYWHAHELGPHAPPAVLAIWRESQRVTA